MRNEKKIRPVFEIAVCQDEKICLHYEFIFPSSAAAEVVEENLGFESMVRLPTCF